jgi:hypothetical protein
VCCVGECFSPLKHGHLSNNEFRWGKWIGMGWNCERGCCHHCCSSMRPGECVVLLIVLLGSVVSGSVLLCGTFFTSKIMIN